MNQRNVLWSLITALLVVIVGFFGIRMYFSGNNLWIAFVALSLIIIGVSLLSYMVFVRRYRPTPNPLPGELYDEEEVEMFTIFHPLSPAERILRFRGVHPDVVERYEQWAVLQPEAVGEDMIPLATLVDERTAAHFKSIVEGDDTYAAQAMANMMPGDHDLFRAWLEDSYLPAVDEQRTLSALVTRARRAGDPLGEMSRDNVVAAALEQREREVRAVVQGAMLDIEERFVIDVAEQTKLAEEQNQNRQDQLRQRLQSAAMTA